MKVKIFDDKGTRVLQVSKSSLTIGSASHCDVVFDDPSVLPEHTRAWLEGGRIWVQDLGAPAGTALNDIRLPALKPMLVRDLDVLRLGECKSTLGLEAVLVRAPVVKPSKPSDAPTKETTAVDGKTLSGAEVEKRREDAAKLGRELADLRLQLQMARLEKNSAEEMGQQLRSLKEEVTRVHEQKEKWEESLKQIEQEKTKIRGEVERELTEFKTNAMIELKKSSGQRSESKQVQAVQNELAETRATLERLEREKEDLRRNMEREKEDLRKSFDREKDEQLKAALREKEEQRKDLEREKEELRKNLERELASLKAAGAVHANEAHKEHSEEMKRLESANKKLERELADLNAKRAASESDAQRNHENELKKLDALNKKLERENSELSSKVSSSGADAKRIDDESRRLKAETESLRKDLERKISEIKAQANDSGSDAKKLAEENRRLKAEHESWRKEMEKQVTDLRAKSIKESAAQMLAEAHKMEKLKQEQAAAFSKTIQNMARMKSRSWTAQGLTMDMVHEWEAEVNSAFRRVVLNDLSPVPPASTASHSTAEHSAPREKTGLTQSHPQEARKTKVSSTRRTLRRWKNIALPSLFAAMLVIGFWYVATYFKFSTRTFSSQAGPTVAPPPPPAPVRFQPKQGKKYRNTYTENVLYLENYVGAEENEDFRRQWQTELNKVATEEWKIDSWTIAPIVVEEQNLIKDLQVIRVGITTTDREADGVGKMRAREGKFMHDLEGIFKSRSGVDRFLKFKRSFYQRNQAYLSKAN